MLSRSQGALRGRFKVVDASREEVEARDPNNFEDRAQATAAVSLTKVKKKRSTFRGKDMKGYDLKSDLPIETTALAGNTIFKEDRPSEDTALMRVACKATAHEEVRKKLKSSGLEEVDTVLLCLHRTNPLRKAFIWLGRQFMFELTVFLCIFCSCIFLVITPPNLDAPDATIVIDTDVMDFWNDIFTFIFTVEFFVRVMAQGLIFTPNAYLKSGWNRTGLLGCYLLHFATCGFYSLAFL